MLQKFYNPYVERCGLIFSDLEVIELRNTSENPEKAFAFDPEEFEKCADDAIATWHTHTHSDPNLSFGDYQFFLSWPKLKHFIISSEAVWSYEVINGSVVVVYEADDYTSWTPT